MSGSIVRRPLTPIDRCAVRATYGVTPDVGAVTDATTWAVILVPLGEHRYDSHRPCSSKPQEQRQRRKP